MHSRLRQWAAAAALIVFMGNMASTGASPLPSLRRVNAPYFPGGAQFSQAAIFWFGKVMLDENYVDARIGYDTNALFVHLLVFDRRLWYDPSPASGNLTDMDSVSLYFNQAGNSGGTLSQAYRFDSQLNWWETPRTPWQAAYRGSGTTWTYTTTMPFDTTHDFAWATDETGGFNNDQDNRGWAIGFHIPWASLGLSGPPPQGTVWGLGVAVHDRDSEPPAAMLPDKTWPETGLSSTNPSTWGQLYFGTPTYTPQPASPAGTVTIRRGLNGDVPDTAVGGGNSCGYPLPTDPATLFTQWGQANYGSEMTFNIRNQVKTADWPCFTKYYVTFPLTAVPAGKVVVSATLTLHQMGHVGEGWDPGPATSYIQVLTVGQDWSESTLNWNNAPMARENVAITVVPPLTEGELEHNDPGPARIWDVSRAAAEAYGAGEPLRLAVYSADEAMQSGKYFWASEHPANFAPEARPSLTVVWGEPAAVVQKTARPVAPVSGQPFTYTLQFLGVREALTLTDNLPAQVSSPGAIVVQGGGVAAYDSDLHQVTWTGMPSVGQTVTVTFPVTVSARGPLVVSNTAVLAGATGTSSTGTAVSIVDARRIWLPMIRR